MGVQVLRSRVLLRPRDLEASLGFYEGVLGLQRSREFGSDDHRGVVLFLGGAELELTEVGDDDSRPPVPAGVRLWLQVPDLDEAAAQVVTAGIPLEAPPELMPWGLIEATVLDPDGLPLVLVEVPAGHPLRTDPRD